MEELRIKYKENSGYSLLKEFKQTPSLKSPEDITDILDLYQLYTEEKTVPNFRYYGTINFISPFSNKTISITNISDLFQTVNSNKFSFENTFNIYFLKYDGLRNNPDGSFTERWRVVANNSAVDLERCGYSTNIYSYPIYNFLVHEDVYDDVLRGLAISHNIYAENQILYGNNLDSNGNIISYEKTDYILDVGGINPITIKFQYRNVFTLNNSLELPFSNNFHYSYNYINFIMNVDKTDDRVLCLFEPYLFKEVEVPSYKNNNPLNVC